MYLAAPSPPLAPSQKNAMASSARIDELRKKFEENPRRYFAPLANEYRKAGDVEQAISICREYLPQQPGHMSGHIVYGQALYEARQFEEAKTVFETALSLDPENLIALRHLGDIALIVADTEGARSWYRRVLEADPRNEEIQAQLATLELAAAAQPPSEAHESVPAEAGVAAPSNPPPVSHVSSSAPTLVVDAIPSTTPAEGVSIQRAPSAPPPIPERSTMGAASHDAASAPTITAADSRFAPPPLPPTAKEPPAEPAAAADIESQPPLTLESPVAGEPLTPGAPSAAGYSLAGLETTSFTPSESTTPIPEPSLSSAPTVELDLAREVPAPRNTPVSVPGIPAAVSAPAAELQEPPPIPTEPPAPVAAVSESVAAPSAPPPTQSTVPLLDLGEPKAEAPPEAPVETSTPIPFLEIGELGAPESPASAPDSGPFVTETMAELYLRQGHREEALRVYRALLDQRPGDPSLSAKIASLQTPPTNAASSDLKGDEPTSQRWQPTMRDVLGAIALRRPGSRPAPRPLRLNGAVTSPMPPQAAPSSPLPAAPTPAPTSAPTATAAPPAAASPPETAIVSSAPEVASAAKASISTDAISRLFDNAQISSADEGAARSLALAFAENGADGVPRDASDVGGTPARRATNELSLDAVFGVDEASPAAAPSTFSFDQFFSTRAATQPGSGAVPPGSAGTASPEEVAHFTKWLEGLKQR
jgi:tetratricopeptide (TPR) repeat protein